MKCEQFLPSLECGGPVRRMLAKAHARQCGDCRAAARSLEEFKRELAEGSQLPTELRRQFLAAANVPHETPVVEVSRRERTGVHRSLAWAALAAAVAIAIAAWQLWRGPGEHAAPRQEQIVQNPLVPEMGGGDRRTVGVIVLVSVDPAEDLALLADEVDWLQERAANLTAVAIRLTAQQAVERVLAEHQLASR
jgi:hypothetical protein